MVGVERERQVETEEDKEGDTEGEKEEEKGRGPPSPLSLSLSLSSFCLFLLLKGEEGRSFLSFGCFEGSAKFFSVKSVFFSSSLKEKDPEGGGKVGRAVGEGVGEGEEEGVGEGAGMGEGEERTCVWRGNWVQEEEGGKRGEGEERGGLEGSSIRTRERERERRGEVVGCLNVVVVVVGCLWLGVGSKARLVGSSCGRERGKGEGEREKKGRRE